MTFEQKVTREIQKETGNHQGSRSQNTDTSTPDFKVDVQRWSESVGCLTVVTAPTAEHVCTTAAFQTLQITVCTLS